LEPKTGQRKLCAQIGNPDIAIVTTMDPHFCSTCNEFYLPTDALIDAILQIKHDLEAEKKTIDTGVYS
jgi:molybdenum cofactor biosynthesis enzyme MoaA